MLLDDIFQTSRGRVVSLLELVRKSGLGEKEIAKKSAKRPNILLTPDGYLFYPPPKYPEIKKPVEPKKFYEKLQKNNLGPIIGVPCSIFKPFIEYLLQEGKEIIIPQNEGPAMGIAAGMFATTNQPAVVFMQNSGLNNAANSLTSLHELYKIPALLIISWRGDKPEAPEHNIMGANLEQFLQTLQIPYAVLTDNWKEELENMAKITRNDRTPAAVVVRKGFFVNYQISKKEAPDEPSLSRLQTITLIKDFLPEAVFISSTGFPSRDSYAAKPTADFYMLGSMGHTLAFAIGVTRSLLQKGSNQKVVCFDGDGSALMHLGTLSLIRTNAPKNLLYVVLNNGVYESTGGQPLGNNQLRFAEIAKALQVPRSLQASDKISIKKAISQFAKDSISTLLDVRIGKKVETGIRVAESPPVIIRNFQKNLSR